MSKLNYYLKYDYYREFIMSYHDAVVNTYNAAVHMYSFEVLDNMNMKYCKTILFDRYPEVMNSIFKIDKKYNLLIDQLILEEEADFVEIIRDKEAEEEFEAFKKEVNDFSVEVEDFSAYFMQLLEELSLKKMFVVNPALLEMLECLFNKIHEECEEIELYLESLREEYE